MHFLISWPKKPTGFEIHTKGRDFPMTNPKKKNLLIAGCCAAVFLLILLLVSAVDVAAIGPEGTSVGLSHLNGAFHDLTGFREGLYSLTEKLGYLTLLLAAAFACLGVYQLAQRRSLRRVDRELWVLAGLYAAVLVLYVLFERVVINYRPVLMPDGQGPEASFPSSHTMLAVTIWGSAFLLLDCYGMQKPLRIGGQIACCVLGAAIVLGRLLCGVHWLTDILAGLSLGAALLFVFRALLPAAPDRASAPQTPAEAPAPSPADAESYRGRHEKKQRS